VTNLKSYDELVAEAESASFSGWDFSWLKGRYLLAAPPWSYQERVRAEMKGVKTMLDMGTGGGEVLSSLQPLPTITFATESWLPNIEVARRHLQPFGASVVQVESQNHLPFDDSYFDLVINRVIRPGGVFITQQVGGLNTDELNQLLQKRIHGTVSHPNPSWSLSTATTQLKNAGFRVAEELESAYPSFFCDVGAVVYFLKHAPWEIPDFDPKTYREPLRELHQKITQEGKLEVTTSRFYVKATKPS
jgi:hypothetical protein